MVNFIIQQLTLVYKKISRYETTYNSFFIINYHW